MALHTVTSPWTAHPTSWYPSRSHELVPFPTPTGSREIYYPNAHRNYHCYPYGSSRYLPLHCTRNPYRDNEMKGGWNLAALKDKKEEAPGDLGWTLDYATAWLYKYLVGNTPAVADAIDVIREIDTVVADHAFALFDKLDMALFGRKLKGMVYMRWKSQTDCSPGTTSAPNIVPGIPRICIELNSSPFADGDFDIDDLLEVLIHQMIHAYFLVCCGSQSKRDKHDGRLMDGVHFGVILMTIRDISKNCEDEELNLIFHSTKRRQLEGFPPMNKHLSMAPMLPLNSSAEPFISIDPKGHALQPPLYDNQTHCMLDNRYVTLAQIKNWQVTDYARALELEMDAKGEKIWDLAEDGKLVEMDRLKAKPSTTYIEVLFEHAGTTKRIMADREKALQFKSLEKPLKKLGKYELEIPPTCDFDTLKCIYDFIGKKSYCATPEDQLLALPVTNRRGPPILLPDTRVLGVARIPDTSILTHVKVFKVAEAIKFEELQLYALDRMWNVPKTTEDPIALLGELYNDEQSPTPAPISAELHKWARAFLAKRVPRGGAYQTYRDPYHDTVHHHRPDLLGILGAAATGGGGGGGTNLQKIMRWYPQRCQDLFQRSQAFRDDIMLARAMAAAGVDPTANYHGMGTVSAQVTGLMGARAVVGGMGMGQLAIEGVGGGVGAGIAAGLGQMPGAFEEDGPLLGPGLGAGLSGLGAGLGGGLAQQYGVPFGFFPGGVAPDI